MNDDQTSGLSSSVRAALGFSDIGAISSRSIMLPELTSLLTHMPADAEMVSMRQFVIEQDGLNKTSARNRIKTFLYLHRIYGLDLKLPIYREFNRMVHLYPKDLQVLAGLLAFAREPFLKACADMVQATPIGQPLGRADFEAWVREYAPVRYSQTMYRSFSHNLYASFFQLGFLGEALGKSRLRLRRSIGAAPVAYAAFLDWLTGLNGLTLLNGSFSRTLELAKSEHLHLLTSAGQLGLMRVAHAGGVLNLDFSSWLRPGESRLTH